MEELSHADAVFNEGLGVSIQVIMLPFHIHISTQKRNMVREGNLLTESIHCNVRMDVQILKIGVTRHTIFL